MAVIRSILHWLHEFFFWEPDYGPLAALYHPKHAPSDHPLLTITKITQ